MLILTRRIGETLMIGDEVTVTVLGVKGNQVRIGVSAPKDVAVHVKRSTNGSRRRRMEMLLGLMTRLMTRMGPSSIFAG